MGYSVTFGLFEWRADGSVDRRLKAGARQLQVGALSGGCCRVGRRHS